MRSVHLFVVAALALSTTACSQSLAPTPDSIGGSEIAGEFAAVARRDATAAGIALGVEVSQRDKAPGAQFQVTTSVTGTSPVPVELKTPQGLDVLVIVRSMDTSETVFDTRAVSAEAVASNPGFKPDESETLEEGSSGSSTYQFSIAQPGHYELVASTFEPAVSITPITLVVR